MYAIKRGMSVARRQDLETAVGEAATNAVVHGGGGVGSVYFDNGTLQVFIQDMGSGINQADLPKAALIRGYSTRDTLGHGLKMILDAVDRVYLLTGSGGTTILLEQDLPMVNGE
jgi:anti-sigma regulatory factor (Ser/Thr protein kinase)